MENKRKSVKFVDLSKEPYKKKPKKKNNNKNGNSNFNKKQNNIEKKEIVKEEVKEEKDIQTKHEEEILSILERNNRDFIEEIHSDKKDVTESFFDVVEDVKTEESNLEDVTTYDISKRSHISFEARVSMMVLFCVLFFFVAFLFIYQAFVYKDKGSINYSEESFINYQTCLLENNYYTDECLNENMEYLAGITKNVSTTFRYKADYTDNYKFKYDYYVTADLSIYDPITNNVYYENEEEIVDTVSKTNNGNSVDFSVNTDIDYQRYNTLVTTYNSNYNLNALGKLEVSLYYETDESTRKVATVVIPLNQASFKVSKELIYNGDEKVITESSEWNNYNSFYASLGVLFALIGLGIFIRLSNLVYKTISNSSIFERKLNQILKDYDKYIVISRGGYSLNPNSRVIKVTSFKELMDARNTLKKPIVYVWVNNVKSEFYVEDVDKVYVYVMKEADFN